VRFLARDRTLPDEAALKEMQMYRALGFAVLILAACQQAPERYDYAVLGIRDEVLEPAIDRAGDQGWEIVAARRAVANGESRYELIMKRRLSEGETASTNLSEASFVTREDYLAAIERVQTEIKQSR
jgi:hypothetical protein